MTRNEFAKMLDGREYLEELTRDEAETAAALGFIVFFGASDDLMEASGMINDEWGAYEGTEMRFSNRLDAIEENEDVAELIAAGWTPPPVLFSVTATFAPNDADDLSWLISTDVPHSTFTIMEDGEKFCRGIVVDVNEIRALADGVK